MTSNVRSIRTRMVYEDLHSRYGAHIARRIQQELTQPEFDKITVSSLPAWLEARSEEAHKAYQVCLDNPYFNSDANRTRQIDTLYRRWQDAEELSYLITVAEDITHANARAAAGGRK